MEKEILTANCRYCDKEVFSMYKGQLDYNIKAHELSCETLNPGKKEKTNSRPSDYSKFHRTFGNGCYAIDIDFVEYRAGRGIVGFFGVTGRLNDENHIINSKDMIWKRTELERKILLQLSEAMKVPSYFVIHTTDLTVFHVHKVGYDLDKYEKMDKEQYKKFISEL